MRRTILKVFVLALAMGCSNLVTPSVPEAPKNTEQEKFQADGNAISFPMPETLAHSYKELTVTWWIPDPNSGVLVYARLNPDPFDASLVGDENDNTMYIYMDHVIITPGSGSRLIRRFETANETTIRKVTVSVQDMNAGNNFQVYELNKEPDGWFHLDLRNPPPQSKEEEARLSQMFD